MPAGPVTGNATTGTKPGQGPMGPLDPGPQRSGIGVPRSTATAVTLFCGEPSITRSE
jgi:hypothetical protein